MNDPQWQQRELKMVSRLKNIAGLVNELAAEIVKREEAKVKRLETMAHFSSEQEKKRHK